MKSHEERLIELNFKSILNDMPNGKHFRSTGSGRLVDKREEAKQQARDDADPNGDEGNGGNDVGGDGGNSSAIPTKGGAGSGLTDANGDTAWHTAATGNDRRRRQVSDARTPLTGCQDSTTDEAEVNRRYFTRTGAQNQTPGPTPQRRGSRGRGGRGDPRR